MRTCEKTGKRRFLNKNEAARCVETLVNVDGNVPLLRIYECPYCFAYHLTSKGRNEALEKREEKAKLSRMKALLGFK